MTAAELIAFEDDIAAEFTAGNIKAPVHLAGGNEQQLIDIFKNVRPQDWILCSWRSHYHCLLKGVPPVELKSKIMRGRSIALCFPEYRVLSSALVGGTCPWAVGIASGIKQKGEDASVWCFIGDMTQRTGIFDECFRYSADLPVHWVVEDNGYSVCTRTIDVWKTPRLAPGLQWYKYKLSWPHVGIGKFVKF